MSFERWVQRFGQGAFDAHDGSPFQRSDRRSGCLFLTRLSQAHRHQDAIKRASRVDESGFLDRVGYGLWDKVWDTDYPVEVRVRAIQGVPTILQALAPEFWNGGAYMLWYQVFDLREFREDAGDHEEVLGAALESLKRQITIPSKMCQISALHGLSELGSAKARSVVESARPSFFDAEVAKYTWS